MACSSALAAKSAEPPMRAAIDLAPLSKLNPLGSSPCSSKYFCPRATDHGRCASSPSCEYAKVTGSPADPARVGSSNTSASTRAISVFIAMFLSVVENSSDCSDARGRLPPHPALSPKGGEGYFRAAAAAASQRFLLPVREPLLEPSERAIQDGHEGHEHDQSGENHIRIEQGLAVLDDPADAAIGP